MVRKAKMVTKYGLILVSFIQGKRLPFSCTKTDIFLRIAPHQMSFFAKMESVKSAARIASKEVNVNCICVGERFSKADSLDLIMSKMVKEGRSLLWLDPTLIPTECLASIFQKWLRNTKSSTNLGLGIVIPSSENTMSKKDNSQAWFSTSSGVLKKEFEEIRLPVWYPSLAREPEFLEETANAMKPFDIFPVVEFPQIINYAAEKEIALHHQMLDRYRTRTRNFIYLNTKSPAEGLRTLYESFQAIPRSGKMPRSLVITPGGKPVSYLVTLLAGVLGRGIFITPEMETPYSEATDTWGYAVFKKCE